uniref:Protein BUD31 homolog n=1 Tax=Capra hircus TaxID=9925 RepID=A0A8C2SAK6_CAPHI
MPKVKRSRKAPPDGWELIEPTLDELDQKMREELYEYCIKEGYADKNLIAKWKKQGYENLCCLRCIQTRDTNFGTNWVLCLQGRIIECTHCGCRGCSG